MLVRILGYGVIGTTILVWPALIVLFFKMGVVAAATLTGIEGFLFAVVCFGIVLNLCAYFADTVIEINKAFVELVERIGQ